MTELVHTKAELLRKQEDRRIAAEFYEMRKEYPEAKVSRIIKSLADSRKFKSTSPYGIRAALIRSRAIPARLK